MSADFQPWIPDALRRAISTGARVGFTVEGLIFPSETGGRLLNDSRLAPFWRWVDDTAIPAMVENERSRPLRIARKPEESDEEIARRKVHVMYWGIGECFNEPHKVDSMILSERCEYFSDVSATVTRLIGLLKGTPFSAGKWDGAALYHLDQVRQCIESDIQMFQRQPTDTNQRRTFFYDEDDDNEDGVWLTSCRYPLNSLTEQLEKLRRWANDPNALGEHFSPYTPIKQRGIRGLKGRVLVNLARKFRFGEWGTVTIPYEHLAELVNAGLDLPEDEQLNKTSARKQIERYAQERDKS